MASLFKRKLPGGGYSWVVAVKTQKKGQEPINVWRTFDTEREAKVFKEKIEKEIAKGSFKTSHTQYTVSFENIIQQYRERVTSLKKGKKQEGYKLDSIIRHFPVYKKLSDISNVDIVLFRDKRLQAVSRTTVAHELALLSHIFNICRIEWGYSTLENPVSEINKPKFNEPRDRRVSDEEIQAIIRCTKSPVLPYVILLALETAMREGELAALTWDMVRKDMIMLPGEVTKTDTSRKIPLSLKALEILNDVAATNNNNRMGKVFALAPRSISVAFRRAAAKAREENTDKDQNFLKNIHFHDIRHEATTRLAELGLTIPIIASITGHKTLEMLKRYMHTSTEHSLWALRDGIERKNAKKTD